MNKNFHKWLDKYSQNPRGNAIDITDCENAWNAARDSILKILKDNIKTQVTEYGIDTWGGYKRFETKSIDIKVMKEIEKL